MSFEQIVLVVSISLNIIVLVGLAVLFSSLVAFYEKVKKSSEAIDAKFTEQDKKFEHVGVLLTTLEMLFTFNATVSTPKSTPPRIPPRKNPLKNVLTIIKSDDKDPPK